MRQTVEQRATDHREQRFLQLDRNDAEQGDSRPADDVAQSDYHQTGYRRRRRFFPERRQIDLFLDGGTDKTGLGKSDDTSSDHKKPVVEKSSRRSWPAAMAAPVYRALLRSTTKNRATGMIFRQRPADEQLTAGSRNTGKLRFDTTDSGPPSPRRPA